MEKYQIDFYNRLTPTEQLILKASAFKISFEYPSEITELLVLKQKLTQKAVVACIEEAVRYNLFSAQQRSFRNLKSYETTINFMLFILPELTDFDMEWMIIKKKQEFYYYRNTNQNDLLRNFLYCLLHDKKGFIVAQEELLRANTDINYNELSSIFDFPVYEPLLSNIDIKILTGLIKSKTNAALLKLDAITEIEQFIEKTQNIFSKNTAYVVPRISDTSLFLSGNFEKRSAFVNDNEHFYYNLAIQSLIRQDYKSAIADFDKGIKIERIDLKNCQLPTNLFSSIYFLSTLLCIDAELATVRTQKILKVLDKNTYSPYDYYFKAILYNLTNERAAKKSITDTMLAYIKKEQLDLQSLIYICTCFLADAKPHASLENAMLKVVSIAHKNGYLILAYEAAYAMKVWFNSADCVKLYNQISQEMSYKAVFSNISRQEEWEKSLNLLLSMGLDGGKSSAKGKDDENKNRVVYYFSPKNNTVQPVLQTRSAKGGWSSGRNIALKTFFGGTVAGMTEQDLRISKTLKRYSNYYDGDYYDFTEKTLVALIGHPYIFLNGTSDVSVELIAAQPQIKVTKTAGGYTLKTDIKPTTDAITLEKETNTRYKLYELSAQQRNIINILSQQKIIVPEQGKDKLIQLLGGFSKHMTVHSDLIASGNERVKVKEVKPDTRIRVQLLPFGDGFKAELYSKPFGEHPPYCKPGVGGKVLIANENGTQLQVKRDLKLEADLSNTLLADIQTLETVDMSDDLISFDEPLDSLHLLDIIAKHKDICVVEWPEGERFRIKGTANFGDLNLRIKSKTNWFELDGELKVDEDTVITIQQLMNMVVKSHDKFIELKDGEFLALSNEMKRRLEELMNFSTNGKDGLQMNKFASMALGELFENVEHLKADKGWKDFRKRVNESAVEKINIPENLQAELRPYQEDGFRWMARLAEWEGGACLADDMGLGKTIQTLSILLQRSSSGPALVVCPVSVVSNWVAECRRFAPTLNIKTLNTGNRKETMDQLSEGDVLITSYGLLQSEEKIFIEKEFATIVLDEAHVIKNYATKTSKVTMQLKGSFRVALTGTPIQNHLGEIWNLFNFINPGLLGTMQHFNDSFVKPDNEFARKCLRKLIAPFILRRTKSAVLDELPPKTEIVKLIQLTDAEIAFYEALRRQALANIESGEGNQGMKHLQVLAEITKLRQASCNPLLVDANIKIASSKLTTFLDIVDELIENKHRALVFSQFVTHLSIVREALDKKGIKYQYLDGSTSLPERERNVKRFQAGEGDLFLISLKAGGLGLNLTAADYVIHMDPWWNPAVEDQASDRAHRIGQNRPVTIYRLVAENTIEEKIIQLHNTKRDMAESLLEGTDQSAKMSMTELVSLIQEGI